MKKKVNTKFVLKRSSLKKETPKKWHRIGNAVLGVLPLIQGAILEMPISDVWQKWSIFGVTCISISIKFLTYFFVEDVTEDPIDKIVS